MATLGKVASLIILGSALGCAGPWASLLNRYEEAGDSKALALARDGVRPGEYAPRWAAGFGHDAETEQDAIRQAMSDCRRWRVEAGVVAPCELYAVGDEVIYGSQYEPRLPSAPTPAPGESAAQELESEGTCFAIGADGVLLTAQHVIAGASFIEVTLSDGHRYPARVQRTYHALDIAVLKVAAATPSFLSLAEREGISVGQTVFTIGFPARFLLGNEPKYSAGEISSLSGLGGDATFLQITVPVQPGNSGGPLLNGEAHVIGVITSTAAVLPFVEKTGALPQNINWAVRADLASNLFDARERVAPATDQADAIRRARAAVCSVYARSQP